MEVLSGKRMLDQLKGKAVNFISMQTEIQQLKFAEIAKSKIFFSDEKHSSSD